MLSGIPGALPGWRETTWYRRIQVQPDSVCTELRAASTCLPGVPEHRPQESRTVDQVGDVGRSGEWNGCYWCVFIHRLGLASRRLSLGTAVFEAIFFQFWGILFKEIYLII